MARVTEELPLRLEDRDALLGEAAECTFVWSTADGWPIGVTMSYLWERGCFWFVTGPDRPRVAAVQRDPRVSVVVRGPARTVTAKGHCRLRTDAETRAWFYPAFAARQAALFPELVDARAFGQRLAQMERMILQVEPERWIGYDGTQAPLV